MNQRGIYPKVKQQHKPYQPLYLCTPSAELNLVVLDMLTHNLLLRGSRRALWVVATVLTLSFQPVLAQGYRLQSFVGVSQPAVFEVVVSAAGELVGAREIVRGTVTTKVHDAWVTLEGMRVVHYDDDKVYAAFYQHDRNERRTEDIFNGIRFYRADDTRQVLFACAFWPQTMDPYLLCLPDGSAFLVRGDDITEDLGTERLVVEGQAGWFFATRIPPLFQ